MPRVTGVSSTATATMRTASSLIIMVERCRAKAGIDTYLIVQADYLFSVRATKGSYAMNLCNEMKELSKVFSQFSPTLLISPALSPF